jgi:hypothetical protein
MRKAILALSLALSLLVPFAVRADHEHWEHEHREHERWEHEHWRPRVYPPGPIVVVPPPAPVCPMRCWHDEVCNPYGWCHWERHCEPRCDY